MAQATYRVARYMAKPTNMVMKAAQRILIYLLRTAELGVTYGGGKPTDGVIEAMHKTAGGERAGLGEGGVAQALSDANWEPDGPSITGHCLMMHGGALSWTSKKQASTSLSSMEAETFAAAAAVAEVMWARGLLGELGWPQLQPTNLWIDNTGAVAVANDAASIGRSRHIARRSRFLLEAYARGIIRARHLAGDAQAADLLTKPLDRKRFVALRTYLMNSDAQVSAEDYRAKAEGGAMRGGPTKFNERKPSSGLACAGSSSAGRR